MTFDTDETMKCPQNKKKPIFQVVRGMVLHIFAGAFIGYFVLHPVSMYIIFSCEKRGLSFMHVLTMSFSRHHVMMALYFVLMGVVFGALYGIYSHRITRLLDKVNTLAITDSLTGICNRRYFFERLTIELERSRRYNRKMHMLMIDIDDFKDYNDQHGHQQGDTMLREFAQQIKLSIRSTDLVARYGGEEFVVIMPESETEQAVHLAERLRIQIEGFMRSYGASAETWFTISVGIAGFPDHGTDVDALLRKADIALYNAKKAGKNTICVSGQDPVRVPPVS